MTKKERRGDKSLDLRVDLKGEIADLLEKIMEERRFQYYAEAVRYCIVEAYTKTEFSLEEEYIEKIRQVLNLDLVRKELLVHNVQGFILKSIDKHLDEIYRSRESIISFNVRKNLHGEELEIAQAFVELQKESQLDQVKSEELAKYMGRRNVKKVDTVLQEFVQRGILDVIRTSSNEYYHAFQKKVK